MSESAPDQENLMSDDVMENEPVAQEAVEPEKASKRRSSSRRPRKPKQAAGLDRDVVTKVLSTYDKVGHLGGRTLEFAGAVYGCGADREALTAAVLTGGNSSVMDDLMLACGEDQMEALVSVIELPDDRRSALWSLMGKLAPEARGQRKPESDAKMAQKIVQTASGLDAGVRDAIRLVQDLAR